MLPTTAPVNASAVFDSAAPTGAVSVCLSVEARSLLCRRFGLTDEALRPALARCLGAADATAVHILPDRSILRDATELVERTVQGRLGWFMHPCPSWQREALKWFPELGGAFSTQTAADVENTAAFVQVVSCVTRREAAPSAHVLTVRELMRLLMQCGFPLAQDEKWLAPLPTRMEQVLAAARALAGEAPMQTAPVYLPARGMHGCQTAEVLLCGRVLRLARVHGISAAFSLAERMAGGEMPFDVVEVFTCAGAC